MVGIVIRLLGIGDYFQAIPKSSKYNTSGKTELWALNDESYVAIGVYDCLRTILDYRRGTY